MAVTLDEANLCVSCLAELGSILSDSIQHGLYIRRRARDDPENLTRRCLLLQRFFEFLEQTHVLAGSRTLPLQGFNELAVALLKLSAGVRELLAQRCDCLR
jgi:hypothetical protein